MLCSICSTPLDLRYSSINSFNLFFCRKCLIGFTRPVPKDLSKYYHSHYWTTPGLLGNIKTVVFKLFQKRRKNWILQNLNDGEILDVGAGEGRFGKSLNGKFHVTSLDTPTSKIKNKDVLKIDFLKWGTRKKFDAIVFWESLEHTSHPQKYLNKASKLLKKHGLLFIEYPRCDSWESKLFGRFWFHLDPPRHLNHLTKRGLEILLKRVHMTKKKHITTSALDYTIWGFVASILNIFDIKRTDLFKKTDNLFFLILISPLIILGILIEVFFSIFSQAPIGLMIAEKDNF